jgi:hypothetical protein
VPKLQKGKFFLRFVTFLCRHLTMWIAYPFNKFCSRQQGQRKIIRWHFPWIKYKYLNFT